MAFQKKEVAKKEEQAKGTVTNYSIYPIRVAVFNSEKGVNVKIERQYKDKDGQYQSTTNMNLSDLPVVVELLKAVIKDSINSVEKAF